MNSTNAKFEEYSPKFSFSPYKIYLFEKVNFLKFWFFFLRIILVPTLLVDYGNSLTTSINSFNKKRKSIKIKTRGYRINSNHFILLVAWYYKHFNERTQSDNATYIRHNGGHEPSQKCISLQKTSKDLPPVIAFEEASIPRRNHVTNRLHPHSTTKPERREINEFLVSSAHKRSLPPMECSQSIHEFLRTGPENYRSPGAGNRN